MSDDKETKKVKDWGSVISIDKNKDSNPGNAVSAYAKSINEFESKPKFYADAETLKQGSGYYDSVEFTPIKGEWIENCQNCHVPMSLLRVSEGATILVMRDSISQDLAKGTIYQKPTVSLDDVTFVNTVQCTETPKVWLCPECSSAWAIILGRFWAKLMINNRYEFRTELIKDYPKLITEAPVMPDRDKPSPDATMCHECHVWRDVKPYSDTQVQHVCPKCKTGQLFDIPKET